MPPAHLPNAEQIGAISREQAVTGALDIANRIRQRLGYPPVDHLYPGLRSRADYCPITQTIYDDDVPRDKFHVQTTFPSVYVGRAHPPAITSTQITLKTTNPTVALELMTPAATKFVLEFDEGEFPEYDLVQQKGGAYAAT